MERYRCWNPSCGRPFAVVYRTPVHATPLPLAVACPHCGAWDVRLVATPSVREADGTYVIPLGHNGIWMLEA